MADIFEEVEEGIRQDKWAERWRKYGVFAYLGAALLLGGVGLNEYLTFSRAQAAEANAADFEAALERLNAGDYQAAGEQFDELLARDLNLSTLAAHYLARVRLDGNGDAAAAADVLADASIRGDGPAEKLAKLKAAYLLADDLSRTELEAMLGSLRGDDSAFDVLALELIAAKALAEGDLAFARAEFEYLRIAANAPPGVQKRADQALAAMSPASSASAEPSEPEDPSPAPETGALDGGEETTE
ncbi:MAG: hypothetical protein QNI84_06445 [Henriciella sp.]|nr:hypothetical protein [Henriciella sp.]